MNDSNDPSQISVAPPPPRYAAAPLENAPGAVASLVCGIIGVVLACTGVVLGIIALVMRKKALAHIQAQPGQYGGQGFCTAGLVLGIISIILGSIWAVYLVVIILVGIFAATSAPMMH